MESRLEKLNIATDTSGNVNVLLTHVKNSYGGKHAIVLSLNLSARFMQWFMQKYVNACPHTDVTVRVEDRRYTNLSQTEELTVVNVVVPKAYIGQKRWPGLPGYYEVRELTGLTEIKDSAMPNFRTEWLKLHS